MEFLMRLQVVFLLLFFFYTWWDHKSFHHKRYYCANSNCAKPKPSNTRFHSWLAVHCVPLPIVDSPLLVKFLMPLLKEESLHTHKKSSVHHTLISGSVHLEPDWNSADFSNFEKKFVFVFFLFLKEKNVFSRFTCAPLKSLSSRNLKITVELTF